ncbi:MAG: TAXI family TRAP transporter solute-binding subunit [Magnetococcales bacterium]|nr:TAXI family TRAP transporter solute-binding subunit [Magnetococcales bacterium]
MRNVNRIAFVSLVLLLAAATVVGADPKPAAEPNGKPALRELKPGHPLVTIASGEIGGLFYPTAGAICRALLQNSAQAGIRHLHCGVEPSSGSTDNLTILADREVELAIAHSDAVRKAWEGNAPFPRAIKSLRSVVTLYTESFTLAVPARSGIKTLDDLKGKPLHLGLSDPVLEHTAREILNACGFKPEETTFRTLGHEAIAPAFKNQQIQAHLFVVGHPDERVWNLASTESLTLVPLTGKCLEPLLAKTRHYVKAVIPGGLYPGLENDTPTLGLRATLMASSDTPEELVYALTKAVVEKLYRFRNTQPDEDSPEPRSLFEGLVAPLHLGAFRYFQEMRVLEFKKTGVDILSAIPQLIDRDGHTQDLELTPKAANALKALRPLIGGNREGEAGIPLTLATSPAAAKSGSAHWLMVEPGRQPG